MRQLIARASAVLLVFHGSHEPLPRALAGRNILIKAQLESISGVYELRNGRLLLSDAKGAAVYVVNGVDGSAVRVGSVGGDSLQYAEPGGFYSGTADSIFLLDRGLSKALVVAPTGRIVAWRSIKRRGVTSSSSDDLDHQRLDAHGFVYFTAMNRFGPQPVGTIVRDSVALLRFDAARQRGETITFLRVPERQVRQASGNFQLSQVVVGSPEDGWGVAPDGRVAVVRSGPYRIDWFARDRALTRGPVLATSRVEFTAPEKDSVAAASHARSASAGSVGGPAAGTNGVSPLFADRKAAFAARGVIVSPSGMVWVERIQPYHAAGMLYDVFDDRGERVDRVSLSDNARVVGFGKNAIYGVIRTSQGGVTLRRYSTSS